MKPAARPLASHRLAESRDPELVRSTVGNAFCDYQLSPLSCDTALDAHFHGLQLNGSGVYYLEYGTEVRIEPCSLADFYMIQVPLAGHAKVAVGTETFISTPDRGSILQPDRTTSMTLENTNRHLLLRLDQVAVHHALRKKLGWEPTTPIIFNPQMDLTTPANHTFRGLLRLLVDAVNTTAPTTIALREFERLLLSQLILGQPNNYRDELEHHPRPTVARPIARAAELIEGHAHEPLTVDDIAEAVGISPRALQDGFRRFYDTTPTAFLRDVRLQRTRTELIHADPANTTVTTIATRWGFMHLGRFSAHYDHKFGETPSQTLKLRTGGPG